MIGWIFGIVFFIGEKVMKDEVLKWLFLVVLVYIVVYGWMEIGEIFLVLSFLICVCIEKDCFFLMIDVL